MQDQKIVGIDIGGTKIHIGLIQDGTIIKEVTLPTSAQAPETQIIQELFTGLEGIMTDEVAGIGVGAPGLIDEQNGIIYNVLNIPSFKKVPIKKYLESYFRKPVFVTNDANCFVLGEKVFGQAKPYKNVVGLTLGTGLGGGIIINDSLYSGTLSSAGEFGSIPYLDKTLEDYCSGKFFQKQFGLDGGTILTQAQEGNDNAIHIFTQYGEHLGNAIKFILYMLSPEAIFLGGSIIKSFPFFQQGLQKSLRQFPFKQITENLIIRPSTIENVAVLGAAALFKMRNTQTV